MKINQKVRYGVACLYELSQHPLEFMDANFIANHQGIPTAYAQKVLQLLAQGGLVIGMKGAGYKLASPIETITVLQVMEILSADKLPETELRETSVAFERQVKEALGSITLSCLGKHAANI